MKIKPNTIIVTIGPSNCGKSYWSTNHALPTLTGMFDTVHYISSDDLRRYILNKDLDKYDEAMWKVSGPAFDLLFAELNAVTSFHANQDVVIVDSTGLNKDFRKRILNIAKKNGYTVQYVVFDYLNRSEYFSQGGRADVIEKHYDKFINIIPDKLINEVGQENYTRIRGRNQFNFVIEKCYEKAKTLKINSENVVIIGDVHGTLQPFQEMMEKTKDFDHVVFIGDIIDKGPENDTETIIDMILGDPRCKVIKGNHEHFFDVYHKQKIFLDQQILDSYFGHTQTQNLAFKEKVQKLVDSCYDFIEGPNWIATHSPCKIKYLGKTDKSALKKQRNFRHVKNTDVDFIIKENRPKDRYHIWGHIPLSDYYDSNFNIGIDTGACSGHYLTAVYFKNKDPKFIQIKSTQNYIESDLHKFDDILFSEWSESV